MRELHGKTKTFVEVYSVLVIIYHLLYASGLFSWLNLPIGGIHPAISVGLIMAILFLQFPVSKKCRQDHVPWYDWILAGLCLVPTFYYAANFEHTLYSALTPSTLEICLGVAMILLCFEGVRRAIGPALVACGALFLIYPLFAGGLPGILFAAPVSFPRLIGDIYLGTQGFFAAGAQVFSTTIIVFVIFGQLINVSGGGDFYLNLSLSAMGGRSGGPAKASVIGSGLFGMISGVAVANVVTTGSITIPMMKRKGYAPEFAGAVETVSSTGGSLMPPVMGVLAFIMADYLGIPYWQIASCAIIPAALYYVAVFLQVSFYSARRGLGGLDKSEVPNLKDTLRSGWPFALPLIAMIVLFAQFGWDAVRVGFAVCLLVAAIYFINSCVIQKRPVREPAQGVYRAFVGAGRSMAGIMPAACLAGIIMASVNMTAIGLRLSSGILSLSGGSLFVLLVLCALCCILMGVAVDLIVIYIIMAVMITPAMTAMGVAPLAAHLFILYYTVVGLITPPVCVATYAAASIAQSKPFRTGFYAVRLGFVALVIPFVFAYKPELLFQGGTLLESALATLFTTAAILSICVAFERWFFRFQISWAESGLLAGAGVLMLLDSLPLNAAGLAVFAVYALVQAISGRLGRKAPPPQSGGASQRQEGT